MIGWSSTGTGPVKDRTDPPNATEEVPLRRGFFASRPLAPEAEKYCYEILRLLGTVFALTRCCASCMGCGKVYCMTTPTPAIDPASNPTIAAFLADGGYLSVQDWALDSDFRYSDVSGEWYSLDDLGPWSAPVDIYGAIEGAIEASGFEAPKDEHAFADRVRGLLTAEGVDRL